MLRDFLPISKENMNRRGWEQCDFVYVTGDAYVDHPSFGTAIISRVLESSGYKVGIIAQPDWKNSDSIAALGEPRLGFLVSSGNMDSMVNHYTVAKKRRQTDAYSPGGVMGRRPDHATTVYCNLIRKQYKNIPIIIGGIEASLRRLAHYDYWSDKVKRSILLDSQADIISYGMGEHSIIEIADALNSGIEIKDITFINGTVFKAKDLESVYDAVELPSYTSILESKKEFAKSFYIQYCNTDPYSGKRLVEKYKDSEYVVQNPPSMPLTQAEMDRVYSLPYMRDYHPSYKEAGGIPAIEEVKFSLTSNRGCFGGCNYCALTFHQGRILQTRSHESILAEANQLVWDKDFKGYIHDVGGPTANFRNPACDKQLTKGACINKQCLFPSPCKNLKIDHSDYLNLLRKLRKVPNVKKVFIRSGLRFDYLVADKDETFLKELCEHHVSGQLKVAPEHINNQVLELMGKPEHSVYERFREKYIKMNEKIGKNQFIVPYLISSHPGSTLKEAIELAEYLRDLGYMPEQVQDFYPTPSTISTCMYYTGLDPRTMKEVYVPKSPHEKAMQRALIQYRNPKNYDLVVEALKRADRMDLIGFDKNCLVRPRQLAGERHWVAKEKQEREKQGRGKQDQNKQVRDKQKNGKSTVLSKTDRSTNRTQTDRNQTDRYQTDRNTNSRTQSNRIQTGKTKTGRNQTDRTQSDRTQNGRNQNDRNQTDKYTNSRTQTGRNQSDRTYTGRTQNDRNQNDRNQSDRTKNDRNQTGRTKYDRNQTAKNHTSRMQSDRSQTAKNHTGRTQTSSNQSGRRHTGRTKSV